MDEAEEKQLEKEKMAQKVESEKKKRAEIKEKQQELTEA